MTAPRPDDDLYDLVPDDAPARPTARPAPVAAPPPPVRPLAYQTPPAKPTAAEPEAIKNLWLPLWLLAGGVVVHTAVALFTAATLRAALASVAVEMVVGTVVMLIGVLIAARVRGIDLGRLPVAAFKLAALSLAPSAIVLLVTPLLAIILFGGVIGWVAQFVLYFALLGVLFDLDESDTWYCVCVIFVLNVAIFFAVIAVL